MSSVTIFSKPNMSSDVTVSGLKVLQPPKSWSFTVTVDFDAKVYDAVKNDSVLLEEMNHAAQTAYQQTCDAVKSKFTAFEKLLENMVDKNAPKAEVDKQIDGLNQSLERDRQTGETGAEQAVMETWTDWADQQSEYKKYKIKIAVVIVGAAAGLITSIVLMATTPFTGGVSAAAGIVGMVKATITLGKEIASASAQVETSQKILANYLKATKKIALSTKAAAKANEYTAAIVKQFVAEAQPNIKGCQTQMATIAQKLSGIEINAHEASKDLNTTLDKQTELQSEFMKDARGRLGKLSSKDAPAQLKLIESRLDDYLKPSRATVEKGIKTTEDLITRLKKAEETGKELEKGVRSLSNLRGVDNKILENVLYFVDIPLGALDGNTWANKATDLVNGLVPVGAAMVYDKISSKVLDNTLLE